jgi:cysteinyl-tRNA synthetase
MIAIIERLIERGHAYVTEHGAVYYDVTSFPGYGHLSGNTLDKLQAGHRQETVVDPHKRHPEDFALWKPAGGHRLLQWPSPWGEGFPGWHIECSAMSMKHLGERFDIHTGGNDNKFPHHEDEIAQSEGAVGHQVVSIWIHGGFLQMGGHKMAKSARNVHRVTDLAAAGIDPLAYRLLCFWTRYRSEMEFAWDALEGAQSRLTTIRQRMAEWTEASQDEDASRSDAAADLDERFRAALADDLDLPAAMVVVNQVVSSGSLTNYERRNLLSAWDAVLGLDLERLVREGFDLPLDVQELVRRRDDARAARDFAASDAIRSELTGLGWEVMDTAEGTRIRRR